MIMKLKKILNLLFQIKYGIQNFVYDRIGYEYGLDKGLINYCTSKDFIG